MAKHLYFLVCCSRAFPFSLKILGLAACGCPTREERALASGPLASALSSLVGVGCGRLMAEGESL
jgi:hypothetical protein